MAAYRETQTNPTFFSFHLSQKRAKKIEGDSIYVRHSLLMLEVCIRFGDVNLQLYFLALWHTGCCLISRLHVAWFSLLFCFFAPAVIDHLCGKTNPVDSGEFCWTGLISWVMIRIPSLGWPRLVKEGAHHTVANVVMGVNNFCAL